MTTEVILMFAHFYDKVYGRHIYQGDFSELLFDCLDGTPYLNRGTRIEAYGFEENNLPPLPQCVIDYMEARSDNRTLHQSTI